MPILSGAQSLKVTALALVPSETGGLLGEARRLHETVAETGLLALAIEGDMIDVLLKAPL